MLSRRFLWIRTALCWMAATVGVMSAVVRADQAEIVLRDTIERTDVRDYVQVRYNPPHTSFVVPSGAFLEYEIWHHPDNVNFSGGVEVMTEHGRFTNLETILDSKGISPQPDIDLSRFTKGKWYQRKFSFATFEGCTISEICLFVSSGSSPRTGSNEVRYRNIRLVDKQGTVLCDFPPGPGWLPHPLIVSEAYTPRVEAQVAGVISGSFEPARWLMVADTPLEGTIHLKNYDSERAMNFHYALEINSIGGKVVKIAGPEGNVTLAPQESQDIPVKMGMLIQGDWRPLLKIHSGERDGVIVADAISAITARQMAERRAPFTSGTFGMGAILNTGDDPASIPALREQGANYFQARTIWSQIEVKPGVYDFTRIRRAVDMARRCGMWAELEMMSGYPDYSLPTWLRQHVMINNAGKPASGWGKSTPFWSQARQEGLKTLSAMLDEFVADPTVIAWNVWIAGNLDNFYDGWQWDDHKLNDYSPSSQEKFRHYVHDVLHLSLVQASQRYGLQLSKWEDLEQPQPVLDQVDLRPIWKDFMDYRLWTVGQVQQATSNLLSQKAPKADQEFMYGGSLAVLAIGNDYDIGIANASRIHGSIHQTAYPNPVDSAYVGTACRMNGIGLSVETAAMPAWPPQHQYAMFELLSQGATAYTWLRSGGIFPCPGPSQGFGELRPALDRMSGAKPVGQSVALVLPYSAQLVDFFASQPYAPRHIFGDLATHMETAGFNCDIYSDRRPGVNWDQYPIVIDGYSYSLENNAVDTLVNYVQKGGKLMLFTRTGQFTPGEPEARFKLLHRLGCMMPSVPKERTRINNAMFAQAPIEGWKMPLRFWQDMDGLPSTAQILARSKEGEPALASWKFGRGTVYLWAGWPDFARPAPASYRTDALAATPTMMDVLIQLWSGVKPPLNLPGSSTLAAVRRNESGTFVVLFNRSAQSTTLQVPLKDIVPSKPYALELVERQQLNVSDSLQMAVPMGPWDVKVVQLSDKPLRLPDLDFPVRMRVAPTPKNALGGAPLRNALISPVAALGADAGFGSDGAVAVISDSQLTLPVPADGLYHLVIATAESGANFTLINKKDNERITQMTSSAATTVFGPIASDNGFIRATFHTDGDAPLALRWVAADPVLVPLASARVSPIVENPGAFPGENYAVALPPESHLASPADWESFVKEWAQISLQDGCLDLGDYAPDRAHGLAYFTWDSNETTDRTTLLSIGVDYGLRLWINGREIFNSTKVGRVGPAMVDEFLLPVQLSTGRNIFVGKVVPGSVAWRVWLKELAQK